MNYEVTLGADALIQAHFDVVLLRAAEPVPVRLDLDDVTFASAESVTVDDEPATIIPASQGLGVILMIPPPAAEAATPERVSGNADWIPHRIVVACRSAVTDRNGRRTVGFRVPAVATATAHWTGLPTATSSFRINGVEARLSGDPAKRVETRLGSVDRIEAEWTAEPLPAVANPIAGQGPSHAVTELAVAPLQQTGRTSFELPLEPRDSAANRIVPLTPGLVVSRGDGPGAALANTDTGGGTAA